MTAPVHQPTWFIALRTLVVATLFTGFWVGGLVCASRFDMAGSLPEWVSAVGLVLAVAGGLLCIACVAMFTVVGRGTPAPFDPPREFVVTGPYRYCRNPMLLGFCVMLLGLAVVLRSPAAIGLAAFAFLCGHLMVVLWEERHLRAKFGRPYIDYCARVPRWMPRF
ncbi:MAG TPA: isoprenylcysteine carboxylmethyltransferase family protein [Rhizomicrobium sp.]|nr:isoprenylcysteine carboxylmethyltransferase family protein [Rhizomicrobium sp.]